MKLKTDHTSPATSPHRRRMSVEDALNAARKLKAKLDTHTVKAVCLGETGSGRPYASWHDEAFNAVNLLRSRDGISVNRACNLVFHQMEISSRQNVAETSFTKMYRRYISSEILSEIMEKLVGDDVSGAATSLTLATVKIQKDFIGYL